MQTPAKICLDCRHYTYDGEVADAYGVDNSAIFRLGNKFRNSNF
jgi:hypothetical protein